jgi:hypothetical protein
MLAAAISEVVLQTTLTGMYAIAFSTTRIKQATGLTLPKFRDGRQHGATTAGACTYPCTVLKNKHQNV